jgi:hypothetical protein
MEYVMQITGGSKDDKGEGLKIIGQLWNEHVGKVVSGEIPRSPFIRRAVERYILGKVVKPPLVLIMKI